MRAKQKLEDFQEAAKTSELAASEVPVDSDSKNVGVSTKETVSDNPLSSVAARNELESQDGEDGRADSEPKVVVEDIGDDGGGSDDGDGVRDGNGEEKGSGSGGDGIMRHYRQGFQGLRSAYGGYFSIFPSQVSELKYGAILYLARDLFYKVLIDSLYCSY